MARNAWSGLKKKQEGQFDEYANIKVEVGIEMTLTKALGHQLETRELVTRLMKDNDLKSLLFNHSEVLSIIDKMVEKGKIDEDVYLNSGTLKLTPEYFKQFYNPEHMQCLGENAPSAIQQPTEGSASTKSGYRSS